MLRISVEKKKGSDMIKEVLKAYGSVKVDATAYQYPEMVQYYCSDWDFALSRADANGLFISTEGDTDKENYRAITWGGSYGADF